MMEKACSELIATMEFVRGCDRSRVTAQAPGFSGIPCAAMIGLFAMRALPHQALMFRKRAEYPAPGRKVEFKGRVLHLYSEGSGKENVIRLCGCAAPSLVLDFHRLMKDTSVAFTIAAVKSYG